MAIISICRHQLQPFFLRTTSAPLPCSRLLSLLQGNYLRKPHNNSKATLQLYSSLPKKNEVVSSSDRDDQVSTTVKTVKETTKTASYGGIILLGIGVTGALFYAVFSELFSGKSPNSVYSKALDKCIEDQRVQMALGEPIKGYGEETRRGRRRHVSHLLYSKDGVDHLRMKFYLKGLRRKATAHLEMKENDRGKWEYRYLFVQMDDYPNTTFILEDNREEKKLQMTLPESLPSFS